MCELGFRCDVLAYVLKVRSMGRSRCRQGVRCLGVRSRVKRHVQHKIPEQALALLFPVADGATLRKTVVMLPRKMHSTFNKKKQIYDFT